MVVGVLAALAGAGVSAAGAAAQSSSEQKVADYNASVQKNQSSIAVQQSRFDATQIAEQTARRVGQQRAAMAASGFDANTGSFVDVTQDTQRKGELAKLSRIYQGQLGVVQSSSAAQLDVLQGQSASAAGGFAIGSSILGGMSTATSIGARAYTNSNPTF